MFAIGTVWVLYSSGTLEQYHNVCGNQIRITLKPAGNASGAADQVMGIESRRHHRRSIRLKSYDYAQPGTYFVTVCTHRLGNLFGEVVDGKMILNVMGRIVEEEWRKTPKIRPYVKLDEYVIMPNHLHGIVMIVDDHPNVGATGPVAPTENLGRPKGPQPGSLGAIIGQFKPAVTKRINRMRDTPGQSVWQRNYYEHIIRDERSLHRIQQYVDNNPQQWHLDSYNPNRAGQDKFEDLPEGI